ncbi:hypothetical protein AB0395_13595 [Streptosporangium sp. NPDC051023]|uniref:hypothetical protein n=1 Tax=Streptosporangium sp. NPDC051023 TaxID=3155410 RepID=UPI00344D5299
MAREDTMGRKLTPEAAARLAEQKAAERKAIIRKIVDEAPPLSMWQISVLSRIFEGAAERMRQRAAEEAK